MSVVVNQGDTLIFTLRATDLAGNEATVTSPPLTIDSTPPEITGFTCNEHLSKAKPQVKHLETFVIFYTFTFVLHILEPQLFQ